MSHQILPSPSSNSEIEPHVQAYLKRLQELNEGKKFHPKQLGVINAIFGDKKKKRIFCRKGRKGGGTEILLYCAVRTAININKIIYLIYPTATLGREIVWDNPRLRSFIPASWQPKFRENQMRVTLPWGSSIRVLGADNYKHMVGIEGDAFMFDELKDHDPRAYKNCYPNIASRDALWMALGAAPMNKNNFYYKTEQAALRDPSWFCTHWSTWDNVENLPGGKAFIEKEKETYYQKGDWDEWEVEWEARYVLGGKNTVLPSFEAEDHFVPYDWIDSQICKDKSKLRWFTIFDPGYATCFAVLFAAINDYTGDIYILDEIYATDRKKTNVKDVFQQVLDIQKYHYDGRWNMIYDSAAAGFPNEVRSQFGAGYSFRPTYKETEDETTYFRLLNSIIHMGRFHMNDTCKFTRWEMENYLTTEAGTFPDAHNHQLDNLRYLIKMSNYKLRQKQDNVIVVPERPRPLTIDDGLNQVRREKDPFHSVVHDSFDGPDIDMGFDF